ncbi:MAG: phosphodiester glycosidase family protein [Pseudonocardia sp.]|nr:phosphodiester glycosidase family protein [Pseudonocardia sp.]
MAARGGPSEAFVLRVDLTNPHVRAGLLYPGTVAAVRPLSAMARAAGAFAAVNGDFFNIGASGAPVGPVVTDGHLIKAPQPGRGLAAGVGADGVGRIAAVALRGYVVLPGGRRPLSDLNDANPGYPPMLAPNGIGLFTPEWGIYRRSGAVRGLPAVTEVLVRAGRVARLTHRAGGGAIAAGSYVLLGAGAGGRALARLRVGQVVSVHAAQETSAGGPFEFALGGKYRLLRDGALVSGLPPFAGPARTAVGFGDGGRTMYLVATQAARRGARGLDLAALARLMLRIGARDAVNLDDGGSTTMVARLPGRAGLRLVNHPLDGAERQVANGIGVFAVPAPPPALALGPHGGTIVPWKSGAAPVGGLSRG